jgi:hypothetical protein
MDRFFNLNKVIKHRIRFDAIRPIWYDRESLSAKGLVWFESILYDRKNPPR